MEGIRINKYLADVGLCSRREADRLVGEGAVAINGEAAAPGSRVGQEDQVSLRGKPVFFSKEIHVLAYYKPCGVTCTERDAHAEKTVTEALDYPVRVTYAGRLDKESEGLLLMANDGGLIQGLMRGASHQEKEYVVRVNREITPEFIQKMGAGIYLRDLGQATRPCQVIPKGKRSFTIILTQGLNRQIRRMCRTLGYQVKAIKRVRIAGLTLGDLRPGEYRRLTGEELTRLYQWAGLSGKLRG